MTKLDEIALNIELVLISIIEAVALTFLAENTLDILHTPGMWPHLPYILAGLIILLVFWSQAILHAVSFIRWPLRMEHMLTYFVAAFIQVIAYGMMQNLVLWFLTWCVFSAFVFVIYVVDLRIIRSMRMHFPADYIGEIESRHVMEMKYLVPIAFVFNVTSFAAVYSSPHLFDAPWAYASLGILQSLISLGALYDCVRNFRARAAMLPSLFSSR